MMEISESGSGAELAPVSKDTELHVPVKVKTTRVSPAGKVSCGKEMTVKVAVEVEPDFVVIRRPDVGDLAFMERMRDARRARGLVGLIEALVEELEVRDADVRPK